MNESNHNISREELQPGHHSSHPPTRPIAAASSHARGTADFLKLAKQTATGRRAELLTVLIDVVDTVARSLDLLRITETETHPKLGLARGAE